MCLWLLTACIGLLPTYTPPANVVIQLPPSILQPTTAATTAAPTTTTAARPPSPPTPTTASNTPATPTPSVTTAPPVTAAPTTPVPPMTPAPTTQAPSPVMTATSPTTNQPPMTTISSATTLPTTASPSLGQLLLPVLLCNNTEVVCVLNPDYYAVNTGPLRIDPRLGTTPAASAAFRIPPINGYNANSLTLDTSVRFPRERRSIKGSDNSTGIKEFLATVKRPDGHRIRKRQSCMCVAAGTCATYGAGLIDLRIVSPGATQCPAGQVYCCTGTVTPTTTPVVTVACGVTQTVPTTGVVPAAGQASFGEYPWQAMVLTKQNDYIAGAVLINQQHVLTVTHRLTGYIVGGTAPNLKVRLGEWDAAATYEPIPFQEYNVTRVFSHPSFNPNTLQYDLTVLRLTPSVPLTQQTGAARTINRACLPPSSNTVYTGQRCWVSGWGKNMFGVTGQYQQILKEVDVPIVAPATCQSQMQTARLGSTFVLDTTSFICAGGEANKDACTGDGGSGLVCQVNGQWVLVGLVSWGLSCANANVPGAYVNVAALLPWIQQQVAAA